MSVTLPWSKSKEKLARDGELLSGTNVVTATAADGGMLIAGLFEASLITVASMVIKVVLVSSARPRMAVKLFWSSVERDTTKLVASPGNTPPVLPDVREYDKLPGCLLLWNVIPVMSVGRAADTISSNNSVNSPTLKSRLKDKRIGLLSSGMKVFTGSGFGCRIGTDGFPARSSAA